VSSLLKELVLLPVAPLRFTEWVAQQVAEEADRRTHGPGARAQELRDIDEARRRGEIDEDEAATLEGRVIEGTIAEDATSGTAVIGGREENAEEATSGTAVIGSREEEENAEDATSGTAVIGGREENAEDATTGTAVIGSREENRAMAERSPERKRRPGRSNPGSGSAPRSGRRLSGRELAQRAQQELAEITALEPEGVTSLERADDDTWMVTVELLELERVPPTDDVLGSYEAHLDENGDLLGYERVARYTRSTVGARQKADRRP
jgi:hypothetical protein